MAADRDPGTVDEAGPSGAGAVAPTREPGAPIPKDELDPELISLRPRTQVGLITAFSIVVLCGYLAIRLLPDLRFAQEGKPRTVAVAQIVDGKLDVNSHVTVPVQLERAASIRIRQSVGVPGLRVVPAIGTEQLLWVVLDGDGWAVPRLDGTYTGRLRRLSELPFAGPMRGHAAAHPAPRFVSTDELRRAKTAASLELDAVTGDHFTIEDDDEVEIVVVDPDAITVIGSFGSRVPDAATWTTKLNGAIGASGASGYHVALRRADEHQAWFDVRYTGARATAAKTLERANLWGARVEPITVRHRAPWSTVTASATGVSLAGATLPWAAVDVIAIHAARPVRGDPWVLIVGDAPAQYWYVTPVYVLLGVIALLFGWALIRTARKELFAPKVPTRA